MNNAPAHLTVTQAAHLLGVHRRTVDRLLAKGSLVRDRKTLTIPRAQVISVNLERQGRVPSESEYLRMKETLITRLMSERFPIHLPADSLHRQGASRFSYQRVARL